MIAIRATDNPRTNAGDRLPPVRHYDPAVLRAAVVACQPRDTGARSPATRHPRPEGTRRGGSSVVGSWAARSVSCRVPSGGVSTCCRITGRASTDPRGCRWYSQRSHGMLTIATGQPAPATVLGLLAPHLVVARFVQVDGSDMTDSHAVIHLACFLVDHVLDGRGVVGVADPGTDERDDGRALQNQDQIIDEVLGIMEDADCDASPFPPRSNGRVSAPARARRSARPLLSRTGRW